ncbi:capsular exopolysaccharide synthesis family protein [Sulfuritortus calidifontis]|uniref:non-specific protein-tyrosine kinase n=1 Tax=Sulfuritortus calidifontis TaxID=1914471 RepID=A0A4R3JX82_9PROT|nr:polysaccharide biosynthesis tyrosine autokinase [Sulfuritortus calidifontis]TCS71926.1 capsular exopolysaccharide synthesis family protein [Sulfuritortus calidifontis]
MNAASTRETGANPVFVDEAPADEDKLDLLEYWRSIAKRKWPILGFALSVAVVAAVIAFVMTPIYRSTVTLLIEADKSKVVSIEDVYSGVSQNREHFQTQVEILKSREVALKTIAKLKLWERPEYDPRQKKTGAIQGLLEAIGFSSEGKEPVWNEATLAAAIYPKFASQVSIEPVRLSQLVKISVENEDKELAARAANTMARVYIENDLETRFQMTNQASAWLQERLGALRESLTASERALQEYRDRTGMVVAEQAAQSGAGIQIAGAMQRLIDARVRRAEAESAYNQIRNADRNTDLSALPAVLRNPIVAEAKRQESDAERKLSELSQRYGREHPKIVQAEAELQAARENVQRRVDTVVASVTREYEAAKATERTLEGIVSQARGAVQSVNRKEFQLSALEREVEANRQMYDMFMKRAKETHVAGDLQTAVARVVDPAVVSNTPVKPKKQLIVLVAGMLGLLGGALTSLVLDRLDNTLKTTEDVETKLKHPLLTTLPILAKNDAERTSHVFTDEPDSVYAEAIRTARTGVLLSALDAPSRVLVISSSLPGEGKTTFAINLALAHAQTKKTLLLDADMRRPTVAKRLNLAPGSKGLSNFVSGAAELKECVHMVAGTNLAVLGAGTIPPNPLELLLSQKFRDALARLQQVFDIIVIDSPPVELVSDAMVLAEQANGVIYVTKANATPYQLVRKGLARSERAGGRILGIVLNQFDFEHAEKYYGDYSGYSKYDYKSAYGSAYSSAYGSDKTPA